MPVIYDLQRPKCDLISKKLPIIAIWDICTKTIEYSRLMFLLFELGGRVWLLFFSSTVLKVGLSFC